MSAFGWVADKWQAYCDWGEELRRKDRFRRFMELSKTPPGATPDEAAKAAAWAMRQVDWEAKFMDGLTGGGAMLGPAAGVTKVLGGKVVPEAKEVAGKAGVFRWIRDAVAMEANSVQAASTWQRVTKLAEGGAIYVSSHGAGAWSTVRIVAEKLPNLTRVLSQAARNTATWADGMPSWKFLGKKAAVADAILAGEADSFRVVVEDAVEFIVRIEGRIDRAGKTVPGFSIQEVIRNASDPKMVAYARKAFFERIEGFIANAVKTVTG